MFNVSEAEAQALLSRPQKCIDIGGWVPGRQNRTAWTCGSGVIDADGVGSNLSVELLFRRSEKTRKIWYKFSVYRRYAWGSERVYQLDVEQYDKPLKNAHDMPHEHMGARRIEGDPDWGRWSFHEVISHFSQRTNIAFEPAAVDPDAFDLKG